MSGRVLTVALSLSLTPSACESAVVDLGSETGIIAITNDDYAPDPQNCAELMCAPGEFCDWPDGSCGRDGSIPVCSPICVGECWPSDGPVCGCDGSTYWEAVDAYKRHVDVDYWGPCEGDEWPPPPSPCIPWLGGDCPAGEKCVPYGDTEGNWNNKCVPVLGDGQVGDTCEWDGLSKATDTCGPDSICWNISKVDDQFFGTWTAFCAGAVEAPQCADGYSCLIAYNGAVTVCMANCDPIAQDCADPNTVCHWDQVDKFMCTLPTADLGLGEPCDYATDCAAGHVCLGAEHLAGCTDESCCASFCDLSDPTACPEPEHECLPFFDRGSGPPNTKHIGVCASP